MKNIILKDVSEVDKGLMSNLYDLIASGENTHEEFMVFTKSIETSSRLRVLEKQLAIYESRIN